jgi:hypothetical protein
MSVALEKKNQNGLCTTADAGSLTSYIVFTLLGFLSKDVVIINFDFIMMSLCIDMPQLQLQYMLG